MFVPEHWIKMSCVEKAAWLHHEIICCRDKKEWINFVSELLSPGHVLYENDVTALIEEKNNLLRELNEKTLCNNDIA